MSEWTRKTIAECAANEPYSTQIGPFGKALTPEEYTLSGVPLLRGVNVNHGRFYDDGFVFISEETADRLYKYESYPGDVLLVHKGTLGQIGLMPHNRKYHRYIMGNSMLRVRCDETKLIPEYLYYWLCSREGQHYLFSRVSQVGVPQIQKPLATLREASLLVPPIDEQKSITRILETLDTKIENLRRQNETLEKIAQTLFKHWFIDFEFPNDDGKPYKSSGGAMVASELGDIPEGWRVEKMQNIIEVRDGTHDSPKQSDKGFKLITSKHLKKEGIDFDSAYFISENDYVEINKRSKVETFDILLSMIGTVGLLYFVQEKSINFAIKNIGLFKTSQNLNYSKYIYLFIKSNYGETYLKTRLAGTTQSYVTLGTLRDMPLIVPSSKILSQFKQIAKSIFDKDYFNKEQIQTLTKIRDTLLPKLMNGQIRVKD